MAMLLEYHIPPALIGKIMPSAVHIAVDWSIVIADHGSVFATIPFHANYSLHIRLCVRLKSEKFVVWPKMSKLESP